MQIGYSPDADVLIIRFREGRPVDSIDVVEGVIAHISEDNKVLEIEILDTSKVVDLENITFTGLRWVRI